VELSLLFALSAEFAEIGVSVEREVGLNNMIGFSAAALINTELGAQARIFMGGNSSWFYWRMAGGLAYFENEFPNGGTKQNYVLSLKLGGRVSEKYSVYLEGRHYSNGHMFNGRDEDTNPGWNGLFLGLARHF